MSETGVSVFAWREAGGVVWLQAGMPGATVAFSTRRGGVSETPYDSLNLGFLTDDAPDRVEENRRILARSLGRAPESILMGLQVHGAEVQVHERPRRPGTEPLASDVQATAAPELTSLVLVADCLPLAIGAPGGVAMAHCGWRGIVAGVVANAVEAVCGLAGADRADVHAVLGPGIRACCYDVGPEVREQFERRGHAGAAGGATLDLAAAVRAELERCGVDGHRFADCELCTSCDPARFYSHRRDGGITGRQAGLAWRSS